MNRKIAIVLILVGVGLFLASFVFSKGYSPEHGFLGSISWMQVVLIEGEFVKAEYDYPLTYKVKTPAYWEGRVAFPLKYALTLSIAIILSGFGYLFLRKETQNENQ